MTTVDINCDLGEGNTAADCTRDALLMPFISRCNIACGGHAGNDDTMALSIDNAMANGLAIGAHPSYPDRDNFGRHSLAIARPQLLDAVAAQIERLSTIAAHRHATLDHIKLHGALYNDAEADPALAISLLEMLKSRFPTLKILGLANAATEQAAHTVGMPFLREGFMDRRYLNNHQLSPRSMQGAVIDDFTQCLQQTLALIRGETFLSIHGEPLRFTADSICLHGDNIHAPEIATRLHRALQRAGVDVRA